MKKGFLKFVVMAVVGFGLQSFSLADSAPTNPYIRVTSFVAVTNGVGGFNYYMYVESYTTNNVRTIVGQVTTNLVTGPWVTADTTKIKYEPLYRYKDGAYYYDRFLCVYTGTNLWFRPVMDP